MKNQGQITAFFSVILLMQSLATFAVARSDITCFKEASNCDNRSLCLMGTTQKWNKDRSALIWTERKNSDPYAAEARRRGLNCPQIRNNSNRKAKIKPSELRTGFINKSETNRRHIQQTLSSLGYYESSVDGLYGRGTAAALRSYNKE